MKKIIPFLLIFITFTSADSKIYTGVGYGYFNTQTQEPDAPNEQSISANAVRLKVGYGNREAYAIEFSLDYVDADPKRYAFDVSLLKAFDFGIYINPFAKVGFGAGTVENSNNEGKSLHYGSFNLGGGTYIPMGEHADIELSYEYKNVSYEAQEEALSNATGHTNILYIGINFRY